MIGRDRRARREKLYGIVLDDLFVVAVCGDRGKAHLAGAEKSRPLGRQGLRSTGND